MITLLIGSTILLYSGVTFYVLRSTLPHAK
ncbi:hypothetical protein C7437_101780 [Psychrobacillus insolitus]|uniref:Uncharacterized protein n=1 Tax=Psychrobacillus insolitus TaxID=1461 RepID=A0A2W7MLL0_9BACI|nr:hypothetical protein C7437_101780 [Psychrobacillus insolitus]